MDVKEGVKDALRSHWSSPNNSIAPGPRVSNFSNLSIRRSLLPWVIETSPEAAMITGALASE